MVGLLLIGGLWVARSVTDRDGVLNKQAMLNRLEEAEEDLARICDYIEDNSRLTATRAAQLLAEEDPNDVFKLEVVSLLRRRNEAALSHLCRNNKRK